MNEVIKNMEERRSVRGYKPDMIRKGIGHCVLGYAAAELPAAKPRKENYVYYVEA